jgi:hypothetical protein
LQGAAKPVTCAKLLEYLSTDRGAPCAFILILPSLGRRSPPRRSCAILRQIAIRQEPRPCAQAAVSVQSHCSCYAGSLLAASALGSKIHRCQDAGAAAVVLVVCRSDAGRRQAHGSRSDVSMAGVVDSRRESGHGYIDANDLERRSRPDERHNSVAFDQTIGGRRTWGLP